MIRDKTHTYRVIRDSGKVYQLVNPEGAAHALGAEEVLRERKLGGAPHVLHAVREDIMRRLISKEGRPGLEGITERKKVPFKSSDWEALKGIAERLARTGTRISPGQLASAIIHEWIEPFGSPMSTMARPSLTLPDSLLYIAFDQIEALIESRDLSKEEMERFAGGLIESAELLSKVIKSQHEKPEEN